MFIVSSYYYHLNQDHCLYGTLLHSDSLSTPAIPGRFIQKLGHGT